MFLFFDFLMFFSCFSFFPALFLLSFLFIFFKNFYFCSRFFSFFFFLFLRFITFGQAKGNVEDGRPRHQNFRVSEVNLATLKVATNES